LEAPLKQIAINAGLEGGVVAEKVRGLQEGWGLNASTGEYVDLIKAGIIDPAKVTRAAAERGLHRGPVPHHSSRHRRQTRKRLGRHRAQHGWHGLLEFPSAGWAERVHSGPPAPLHRRSS